MSAELNQRIYNNYRSTLKSLNKVKNYSEERAGERRQKALKMTADRYRTPVSQVKAIVKEFDVVNNITHEHDPAYSELLRVNEVLKEFKKNTKLEGICAFCGSDDEKNSIEIYRMSSPIEGEIRFAYACFDCEAEGSR